MVEESDRIWLNLDTHQKSLGDHCIRITKLEQDSQAKEKSHKNLITYVLSGVITLQFIFLLFKEYM